MPEKRPRWNRLSATELERERAQVRAKERQLRQRLARQEQAAAGRRLGPQHAHSLDQLRQQVTGMQATALALQARAQHR